MNEHTHRDKRILVRCPNCEGHKGVMCKGPHGPGMDVCPRCKGAGEVDLESLTELEKNPPPKVRFERDDL